MYVSAAASAFSSEALLASAAPQTESAAHHQLAAAGALEEVDAHEVRAGRQVKRLRVVALGADLEPDPRIAHAHGHERLAGPPERLARTATVTAAGRLQPQVRPDVAVVVEHPGAVARRAGRSHRQVRPLQRRGRAGGGKAAWAARHLPARPPPERGAQGCRPTRRRRKPRGASAKDKRVRPGRRQRQTGQRKPEHPGGARRRAIAGDRRATRTVKPRTSGHLYNTLGLLMGRFLGLDSSTQSLSALIIDTDTGQVVVDRTVPFGERLPQYGSPKGFLPNDDPRIKHSDPAHVGRGARSAARRPARRRRRPRQRARRQRRRPAARLRLPRPQPRRGR